MQTAYSNQKWLHWGPIGSIRRNHALEHATLQVMGQTDPSVRAVGYSDARGFWLIGDLKTSAVELGLARASQRLQQGERALAIHPNCGTNLATSAVVAGTLAWLGTLGAKSKRDALERLPLVITLSMLGLFISQPLGPLMQLRFTTEPSIEGLRVLSITRTQRGDTIVHRILTQYHAA